MKNRMRLLTGLLVWAPWFLVIGLVVAAESTPSDVNSPSDDASKTESESPVDPAQPATTEGETTQKNESTKSTPMILLISALTILILAIFVGFEVISKVPTMLHTPLMSGSNAISGITIVGAILVIGSGTSIIGSLLGTLAVVLAMTNVTGGFMVTHRMLSMFQKK